jgi:hypothetical protein
MEAGPYRSSVDLLLCIMDDIDGGREKFEVGDPGFLMLYIMF